MNVSLSPASAEMVQQQLATGLYDSPAAVIDHALQRLSLEQPKTKEALIARLRESRRQLDDGQYIEFDQQAFADYREEVKSLARRAANGGNCQ